MHLYEEHGTTGFAELEGEVAFAQWDANQQVLVPYHDRFGVHPLFYSFIGDRLYFASEIKALLRVPDIDREADLQSLATIWTTWAPPFR